MDVSENSGTPKSYILIGFSIINHPFWGTPIVGNPYILADAKFHSVSKHEVNLCMAFKGLEPSLERLHWYLLFTTFQHCFGVIANYCVAHCASSDRFFLPFLVEILDGCVFTIHIQIWTRHKNKKYTDIPSPMGWMTGDGENGHLRASAVQALGPSGVSCWTQCWIFTKKGCWE